MCHWHRRSHSLFPKGSQWHLSLSQPFIDCHEDNSHNDGVHRKVRDGWWRRKITLKVNLSSNRLISFPEMDQDLSESLEWLKNCQSIRDHKDTGRSSLWFEEIFPQSWRHGSLRQRDCQTDRKRELPTTSRIWNKRELFFETRITDSVADLLASETCLILSLQNRKGKKITQEIAEVQFRSRCATSRVTGWEVQSPLRVMQGRISRKKSVLDNRSARGEQF